MKSAPIDRIYAILIPSVDFDVVLEDWRAAFQTGLRLEELRDSFFWVSSLIFNSTHEFNHKRLEWNETFEKLQIAQDYCQFTELRISSLKRGILVENLAKVSENSEINDQNSCVLLLLLFLADQSSVAFITKHPKLRIHNQLSWIVQSGRKEIYSFYDQSLNGSTQLIGISDTGLDRLSCFFYDEQLGPVAASDILTPITDFNQRKVVQYIAFGDSSDGRSRHGTHVSGIVAGQTESPSADSENYNGISYASKIAFFDIGTGSADELAVPNDVESFLLSQSYDIGARIHSASWGSLETTYGLIDQSFDDFIYKNPDMVIVVAAGNCGLPTADCLIYGMGSVGSPALAKNIISVGASYNDPALLDGVASFSSKGPTIDGRFKPDILAPGTDILSAAADLTSQRTCAVVSKSGTSMATPVVAGSVSLIRDYFVKGFYPGGFPIVNNSYQPSSAMVKAVLINGATDIKFELDKSGTAVPLGLSPGFSQGFGRVNLENSLKLESNANFSVLAADRKVLRDGQNNTVLITVMCKSFPIRATLVWSDPPASLGSIKALVNDLDLTISSDNGSLLYFPNLLNAPDTLNNVERIIIPAEELRIGQELQVTVRAASINPLYPVQSYALVVSGCFSSPDLNIPLRNSSNQIGISRFILILLLLLLVVQL
jgi:hypothetical protein